MQDLPGKWNSESGFEALFKELYAPLYRYASGLIADEMQAEELVQEVFLKLWQQREQIKIETNVQAYLYRAVHNNAMNLLNHEKVKAKYQTYMKTRTAQYADSPSKMLDAKELKEQIAQAMNKIPEKCRAIFFMSRQESFSYKEIAEKLGLSIKTVENQMSKALKILREELRDYLPFAAILFFLFEF